MRLCNNIARSFLLVFIGLTLFAGFAYAEESVTLRARVVSPEYTKYSGRGYLNLGDQVGIGSANLKIPDELQGQVRIEILRGSQISDYWSWNIIQHSHSERSFKNYDYTKDIYDCVDSNGRSLKITVQGYYRQNSERITAFAYGTGVLFSGQIR